MSDENMRRSATERIAEKETAGKETAGKRTIGKQNDRRTGRNRGKACGRLCLVSVLALFVCSLTGCRLALEEAPVQDSTEDRLVGILMTEEYLAGGIPELTVNSRGEISFAEKSEKIDGTLVFDEHGPSDVVFEGIEGYGIYNITVWNEEQDSHTSYAIGDDIFSDGFFKAGDENSVEVTVYVEPGGPGSFYFNPVYQTAQGNVYMYPGTGLSWAEGMKGASSTHTMSQKRKVSTNGQEIVESNSFAFHITCVEQITSYRLLFMDRDSNVTDIMQGDELAEMWDAEQWELTVPSETAYLILEQEKENGEILRTICSRGEEPLEFLLSAGGGYMVKRQMNIVWE